MKRVYCPLLLLLLIGLAGGGAAPSFTKVLEMNILPSVEKLKPGQSSALAIELTIHEPWHINSHTPAEEYLIATEIQFDPIDGITFGKINYPKAVTKQFAFSATPLRVYEQRVYLFTTVAISPDFQGDSIEISGTLTYQACNDQVCLPPEDLVFSRKLPVAAADEIVKPINTELFSSQNPVPREVDEKDDLVGIIERKGLLISFLFIFISGLLLNLTPCVYPLIPITISYFGGQAGGKKGSLLLHASIYVLGMATTYSLLGVFAALTGSILGGWLQNPYLLLFIAVVMLMLALSMFGLYEIRVPAALSSYAGKSKQGFFGTLFMGFTVGIIAAPCIGPFVLALFTYVGEKGDPFLGFWMFFTLSMGLSLPFIFLAMFSGALNRLPRSGEWMVWVRKIFGFVLIGVALYFLAPLIANDLWYYALLGITSLTGGIYLAWIDPTTGAGNVFRVMRTIIGLLFILGGVFFATTAVEAYVNQRLRNFQETALEGGASLSNEIAWQAYEAQSFQIARMQKKPVMIDFFADWCIPCKELDKFTFTNQAVVELSRKFLMLKADLTRFNNPEVQKLKNQFNVKGVPTLIFLSPDGKEVPSTRVIGFIEAEKLLPIMQKVTEYSMTET